MDKHDQHWGNFLLQLCWPLNLNKKVNNFRFKNHLKKTKMHYSVQSCSADAEKFVGRLSTRQSKNSRVGDKDEETWLRGHKVHS